jgi:hypothetical protein
MGSVADPPSIRGAAMPIRFRCVYCNQLLGISRRKAGTVVRCTSCQGQLIVPDPSDPATEAAGPNEAAPSAEPSARTEAPARPDPAAGGVFEDSMFDAFLEPLNGGAGGQAVASPPAPSARRASSRPVPAPPVPSVVAAPVHGVTVSRRALTVAIVSAVLGVGLSFAAGLWLGLALR